MSLNSLRSCIELRKPIIFKDIEPSNKEDPTEAYTWQCRISKSKANGINSAAHHDIRMWASRWTLIISNKSDMDLIFQASDETRRARDGVFPSEVRFDNDALPVTSSCSPLPPALSGPRLRVSNSRVQVISFRCFAVTAPAAFPEYPALFLITRLAED